MRRLGSILAAAGAAVTTITLSAGAARAQDAFFDGAVRTFAVGGCTPARTVVALPTVCMGGTGTFGRAARGGEWSFVLRFDDVSPNPNVVSYGLSERPSRNELQRTGLVVDDCVGLCSLTGLLATSGGPADALGYDRVLVFTFLSPERIPGFGLSTPSDFFGVLWYGVTGFFPGFTPPSNPDAAVSVRDELTWEARETTPATVIPEPSTWLLVAAGGAALAVARRRRA